jgi:hypothetical protein
MKDQRVATKVPAAVSDARNALIAINLCATGNTNAKPLMLIGLSCRN